MVNAISLVLLAPLVKDAYVMKITVIAIVFPALHHLQIMLLIRTVRIKLGSLVTIIK
jgi:hypothetical protein